MFDHLRRPVDSAPLAVLRFILGVTFWFWATGYLVEDRWRVYFLQPVMLFKYAGFEWVTLWPGEGIEWHFQITRIAAILFAIGCLTRVTALMLALSMTYVLLVERQIYNNHDYLLACSAFLCVALPCARRFSVDCRIRTTWAKASPSVTMPMWQWTLVRFQLGMPYVFGAIAKLDADWLAGQPAGLFVNARTEMPWIGPLFETAAAPYVMAWGGLVFDLLIVPALLWKRSRRLAVLAAVGFHLTNATIFSIGVFPWFMLATLYVFFPVNFVPRLLQRFKRLPATESGTAMTETYQHSLFERAFGRIAVLYVVVQLLLPVRPCVLPGNPSWNERGQRFAWRMMLRHKDCLLWYKLETADEYRFVPASLVMTPNQRQRAPRDPELVRQAAIKLQDFARQLGAERCRVYALNLVSLNGRPAIPLVDPDADLTAVERGWFRDDWVLQDPGDLPDSPWRVPFDEWWRRVPTPLRFAGLTRMRPSEAESAFWSQTEQERATQ